VIEDESNIKRPPKLGRMRSYVYVFFLGNFSLPFSFVVRAW